MKRQRHQRAKTTWATSVTVKDNNANSTLAATVDGSGDIRRRIGVNLPCAF